MSAGRPPRKAKPAPRQRLDRLLAERGLAESADQAARLIMAGEVTVDGVAARTAGQLVRADAALQVAPRPPYVSRGGLKLAAALDEFGIDVTGETAIDVGASTGGFSDLLLQRGVARLFAIDVGYGQLAWKVRSDPRVVVLDRTNIRHLDALPGGARAGLAVIDASFIGLELVLPAALRLLTTPAQIVALVKPQFEARPDQVEQGGVVRDEEVRRAVLEELLVMADRLALEVAGITVSPAPGPAGNVEFLLWLKRNAEPRATAPTFDRQAALESALKRARVLRATRWTLTLP